MNAFRVNPRLIVSVFGVIALLVFRVGSNYFPNPGDGAGIAGADEKSTPKSMTGASYNAKGELSLPQDHREWIFVGATVTPHDMNKGKAAFPEFHNVYMDPASFTTYKKTGKFPDGTMMLKELVSVGGKKMDSGNGYFQGEYISLEAAVKDRRRFANEPGNWAFFHFGEAPRYYAQGQRMKTEDCNSCHAGANEDYVFTATYPVLRAAKAKIARP